MHYRRWKRSGDPTFTTRTPTLEIKAWVDSLIEQNPSHCITWPFARDPNGYGAWIAGGYDRAHRGILAVTAGPPMGDLNYALHACGRGHAGCVTPRHLYWGTQLENVRDAGRHGSTPIGVEHHGAKLDPDAVRYIRASGKTGKDLAQEFGVNETTISSVRNRRSSRHIT